MDNYQVAETFSLLSKLTDIHGADSFKAKTYAAAAFNIEKLPEQLNDIPKETVFHLKGIGESIGKKIIELLETGTLASLNELVEKTPVGILEMMNIKGIGPKKISVIWKEMGIETIGELLYACEENRLKNYKGFGEKMQANIAESITFYLHNKGTFLFSQVNSIFSQIKNYLEKLFGEKNISVTGAFRRQELKIEELEFIVNCKTEDIQLKMQTANPPELLEAEENTLLYKLNNGLKIRFYSFTEKKAAGLFNTTGHTDFIEAFYKKFPAISIETENDLFDDTVFFEKAGITYIQPFLREKEEIIEKAISKNIPELIQPSDIKGIIHCHSNWSDGSNTLEDMAKAAIDKGFEYLVISDHSKSAFYANGLYEPRIAAQHRLIDELNKRFAPFKIFKSIECDILNDGSLDYSNEILSTFDLVIASIHSNLKMTEEKAMQRLLKAIENPYTTILGHLTGRLLLSRKGYPVNHKEIIDACAAQHVVIEINANPNRLDMDWSFIEYALEKNVLLSINPDAHELAGFDDIYYGVLASQKGMLVKEKNLSSFSLNEFEYFLEENKKLKIFSE